MTKRLINYLTTILFLIPFTLLIVDNKVLFPFITTKAIIFRILVSIGFVFAVWLLLLNLESFQIKRNYLLIGAILFFLANVVSTVLSVNPYRSFWGNAERMDGLWSLFFYLLYFFLLITLFQFDAKAKKTIFYSILIVTTFISLYEINQAFFLKQERPSATLGNSTYIGFMNLLTIFLIFYFLFEKKFQLTNLENLFYIFLIIINLLSLIGSQTRGSILGLLAGIFAGALFYLLFAKIDLKKKIFIFSLFFVFLIAFFSFLKTEISLKIPGLKRISETLQNPVSVFPRIYAWKIFLEAFKKRPIFGWGPETEPVAFFSAFDPKIFLYEIAIFDRPHNKFIEVLVKTGIFGFISWLFFIGSFIYYLYRKKNENLLQTTSLFAFLFAYLGQAFSLFDMQASYLLFFFGLSLALEKIEIKPAKERFIRPYLILVSGLSLIFIIIHLQHYYLVRKIITYLRTPDPKIASQGFLRISEIAGPFLTEEAILASNYLTSNATKIKESETFLNFYEVIDRAYQADKSDYRLSVFYIEELTLILEAKRKTGVDLSSLNKDIEKIRKIYTNLLQSYPEMPEIYINFAYFLSSIGETAKADEILLKGERIFANRYPKYFLDEAGFYIDHKNNTVAFEKFKLVLKQGVELKTERDFTIALKIYLANKDVENSKAIISSWLKVNNSEKIKAKIKKILEDYNFSEILKLDK